MLENKFSAIVQIENVGVRSKRTKWKEEEEEEEEEDKRSRGGSMS